MCTIANGYLLHTVFCVLYSTVYHILPAFIPSQTNTQMIDIKQVTVGCSTLCAFFWCIMSCFPSPFCSQCLSGCWFCIQRVSIPVQHSTTPSGIPRYQMAVGGMDAKRTQKQSSPGNKCLNTTGGLLPPLRFSCRLRRSA